MRSSRAAVSTGGVVGALATGVVALLISGALPAQDIYRWVDETGQVHFGTTPPAGAVFDEVQPPPPPAMDESEAAQRSQHFVEAHEQAEAARQEQREASAKAEAQAAENAANCQRARERVGTLELNRRIVDEQGNTLDDSARLERLEDARKQVAEYCQ